MQITLGDLETGKPLKLDVDVMLRTRLLIQASSGSGKSWLLRRIAEQLFGKVMVIIIDPEGEFATLRERHGYVLVGQGGETPADVRSAGLVAHKLLELHASAVCDLYEMKPAARHEWVKAFLDALIDAPKKLWQRVVVIVDEAHLFAPEKGAGESVASEAMIALTTRGRKRGFGAVFATQRLGKLRKDAAAELLNVLIGQTFIDVDQERAVKALGVQAKEVRDFNTQLKLLPPGSFFALGTALSIDRVRVRVGAIETSHPKPGSSKHAAAPPPAPAKVKALLPQLGDLPKEAEEKARTEAELKRELGSLRQQLREAQRAQPAAPKAETKTIERFILKDGQLARAEALIAQIDALDTKAHEAAEGFTERRRELTAALTTISRQIADAIRQTHNPTTTQRTVEQRPSPQTRRVAPALAQATSSRPARLVSAESSNGDAAAVGKSGLRRMLIALAQRPQGLTRSQLGLRARVSVKGGSFDTYLSKARVNGWADTTGDRITLTDAGLAALGSYDPLPEGPALLAHYIASFGSSGAARMLQALAEAHPRALTRAELADASAVSAAGGSFDTYLSKLRTLELVEGRAELRASDELFD